MLSYNFGLVKLVLLNFNLSYLNIICFPLGNGHTSGSDVVDIADEVVSFCSGIQQGRRTCGPYDISMQNGEDLFDLCHIIYLTLVEFLFIALTIPKPHLFAWPFVLKRLFFVG